MKRFLTHNALLKAVSLVLAVALWFFVVGEERAEMSLSVPLELINVPSDLVIISDIPASITVRVTGPRRLLRSLQTEAIQKTIDLKDTKPGTIFVDIRPESLFLPTGVQVVSISPKSLRIVLDRRVRKAVKIFPSMEGRPAPGYVVTSVTFTPSKALIEGPASILATLQAVWTRPLNVDKKKKSFKMEIALDIRDPYLSRVSKQPIVAEVKIEEKPVSKVFKGFPIQVLNPPARYQLDPKVVDISVSASPSVIRKAVQEKRLLVQLDLYGLKPGRYLKQVFVKLPQGMTLLDVVPSMVEIVVK